MSGFRKRCYKNFSELDFLGRVKDISWFNLYMCEESNTAVKILDELAPIKTIQMRTRYEPWLTKETKVLLKGNVICN